MEDGDAVGEAIDPIKHEAMQMNIEIGGGAKALDEGDGAGLGLVPCQTGVFDHKSREGAVDHLQHRRK